MTDLPQDQNYSFTATIGVDIKGEIWPCVEIPDSAEFFGTRRSVRVDATVNDIPMPDVGLLVTGRGGHMLSLSAAMRKRLGGKDLGDEVVMRLHRRLR